MDTKPILLWVCIAFGALVLVCAGLLVAMFPSIKARMGNMQVDKCAGRLRQVYRATQLYSEDNGGRIMLSTKWMDGVEPYGQKLDNWSGRNLRCSVVDRPGHGFSMNSRMSGEVLSRIAKSEGYLIFDSTNLGTNANDPMESMPNPGRHKKNGETGNNFLMLNGDVDFMQSRKN